MATCMTTQILHTFCAFLLVSTIALIEINNNGRKSKTGKIKPKLIFVISIPSSEDSRKLGTNKTLTNKLYIQILHILENNVYLNPKI